MSIFELITIFEGERNEPPESINALLDFISINILQAKLTFAITGRFTITCIGREPFQPMNMHNDKQKQKKRETVHLSISLPAFCFRLK